MKKPSNISHPLIHRTGTSQRNRVIEALQSDYAPIDGKTLADRLYIISRYAQQINYYEYIKNGEEEYQDINNWTSFFQSSLPFQLSILSKTSIDSLEKEFTLIYQELKNNPSKQGLESLLGFINDKFITPTQILFTKTDKENNGLAISLLAIIKSSFIEPLKKFIAIHNASATFLCVTKKNFSGFINAPWQLKVGDVFALDSTIQASKKGKKEAILKAGEAVNAIFFQLISGFQDIIETAPSFIEEALNPLQESLQKRHQPHIALVFTFLELFKNLQVNVNDLGKKHLDFFYQQVLKIAPKDAVPDKAHIIFEIAKHLEEYPLKKGLLLKDGKDDNNEDIQFELNHEVIIDKAQVTDLRTLSVNTITDNSGSYIEGVYIAPVANSVDGLGKKFKKDQTTNWATLGSKYSKLLNEESNSESEKDCDQEIELRQEHPNARLGFVLASPVLLLQEGNRVVNFQLECQLKDDANFIIEDFFETLNGISTPEIAYLVTLDKLNECIVAAPGSSALSLHAQEYVENYLKEVPFKIVYPNELLLLLNAKRTYVEGDSYEGSEQPEEGQQVDVFTSSEKTSLRNCIESFETPVKHITVPIFVFNFSGEKEWLNPEFNQETTKIRVLETSSVLGGAKTIVFDINIKLALGFPAITFFDEEKLKEKLDIKQALPVVKIELNKDVKIDLETPKDGPGICVLKGEPKEQGQISISPYHFLEQLKLTNACIDVNVCGVKNLIVQNDESTLDINSQIFPFGLRPEVPGFDPMNQVVEFEGIPTANSLLGPSFYIGSKEVLFKKWNSVRVNIEWKDKPDSFNDHYKAYLKRKNTGDPNSGGDNTTALEDLGLAEKDFKLKIDTLKEGIWTNIEEETELFSKTVDDFGELYCNNTIYGWEVQNDANPEFIDYNEPLELFKTSRNGFLKFTLANQDFLHTEYPFVLARQMLAYALLAQNDKLTDAIYVQSNKTIIQALEDFGSSADIATNIQTALDATRMVKDGIDELKDYIDNNRGSVDTIITTVNSILSNTVSYMNNNLPSYLTSLEDFRSGGNPSLSSLSGLVTTIGTIRTELNNRNESLEDEVDAIIVIMNAFFSDAITILTDSNTGLQNLATTILTAVVDTNLTLSQLLNAITVPSQDIQVGINNLATLVQDNNNSNDTDGLRFHIEGLLDLTAGIRDYITNNLDGFIQDLTALDTDLIAEMGLLINGYKSIQQFLDNNIGNASSEAQNLQNTFNTFVSDILSRITGTDKLEGLTEVATTALEELETTFNQSNVLSFLFSSADQALIPNEPWTPAIKNLYVDYSAKAVKEDVDIIHLYPYVNTSKFENIEENPGLFPFLNDEGTLFVGIENLTPGGNLSILFQLAEATADSEMDRATIKWHYLNENVWIELLPDFNIISDETDGLTVSGIVTIAIPDTISKIGNRQMPDDLYWIRITAPINAKAVAETIGIHTQAAKASAKLSELNDKLRLNNGLAEGSISKLSEGDFSVKKVEQLYPSFEGRQPEGEGHFYVRVSEHLKHKGRAQMLSDYEKIVLEGFPKIYKAKCISHTMGLSAIKYQRDLEIAPGYIVITVIPDLTKLASGNQLEPKAPLSLLEKIGNHLRKKISPFARIKVMNPRYEYVDVDITVRLFRGKPANFYSGKLKEDITNLLAPWFLGDSEKIAFGMPVLFSDVVGFVEQLDYVDFITSLTLKGEKEQIGSEIKPLTARSILTAGKICITIDEEKCPDPDQGGNPDVGIIITNE